MPEAAAAAAGAAAATQLAEGLAAAPALLCPPVPGKEIIRLSALPEESPKDDVDQAALSSSKTPSPTLSVQSSAGDDESWTYRLTSWFAVTHG